MRLTPASPQVLENETVEKVHPETHAWTSKDRDYWRLKRAVLADANPVAYLRNPQELFPPESLDLLQILSKYLFMFF
jgi:hypothetical protein